MIKYEIIKELGSGDNAVVFLVAMENFSDKQFALKVIKDNSEDIRKEIIIHKKAGSIGIAPPIISDFVDVHAYVTNPLEIGMDGQKRGILMPLIETFVEKNSMSHKHQKELVRKTWIMILNGIIHNDLHQGNVGIMDDKAVIFDFGLAEEIPKPSNLTIMRQLLISQLFSLLTTVGCNENNKINLCGDQPIHNAIYYVKTHRNDDCEILSQMLGDRYDPCQALASKKAGKQESKESANFMQFVKKTFT